MPVLVEWCYWYLTLAFSGHELSVRRKVLTAQSCCAFLVWDMFVVFACMPDEMRFNETR
jgi:hypothetical protein